jgi:hypothetical protein
MPLESFATTLGVEMLFLLGLLERKLDRQQKGIFKLLLAQWQELQIWYLIFTPIQNGIRELPTQID